MTVEERLERLEQIVADLVAVTTEDVPTLEAQHQAFAERTHKKEATS